MAYRACMSLLANDCVRGPYVKRFWFWMDPRRAVSRDQLPQQFWQTIQVALSTMTELKDLLLHDPSENATWILDPDELRFQLHTAKFRLVWDENMVAFLSTQTQLKHLQTLDAPDLTQVCGLPEDQLPSLETFEGPLMTAAEVLPCPRLTHLRTSIDEAVFHLLPQLIDAAVTHKTPLCSLHVNLIPETILGDTLDALTSDPKWCARVKHLGVIAMPYLEVSTISLAMYAPT